jgi:hypothetical protein
VSPAFVIDKQGQQSYDLIFLVFFDMEQPWMIGQRPVAHFPAHISNTFINSIGKIRCFCFLFPSEKKEYSRQHQLHIDYFTLASTHKKNVRF